jgi:hypothetical protein
VASPCHGSEFHDVSDGMTFEAQIASSPSIRSQMCLLVKASKHSPAVAGA